MATAYQIQVSPSDTGLWKVAQTDSAARRASELLQRDLLEHHVFYNDDGFHNHVAHHILALFGTGGPAPALQQGYDENAGYQRPAMAPHDRVQEELQQSWDHAKKYLGKEQYYPDFLAFFQAEIEKNGYEAVLNERVFKGDEAADDMLLRLFGGFLHPLIQLMYGLEWKQPAIVAEGLAQAAVHKPNVGPYLLPAEQPADTAAADPAPSIASLYDAVRADPKLASAARFSDANKVIDGVLARAPDEMLAIARRVRVRPEELDERTVEMFNAALFMAAAAAVWHPTKRNKFDFFYMHHVNSSPFFLTANAQPWISTETKVRLLEWKIRMDLVQYAARGCPPLSLDKIAAYRPRGSETDPLKIAAKLHGFPDDGHAMKLARAAGICRQISAKHEHEDWLVLKGDDVWNRVQHLIVDSVQGPGNNWVRMAGNEEAWKDIEDESKL